MLRLRKFIFKFLIFFMYLNLNSSSPDNFNEDITKNNQKIRELYESDIKFNIEMEEIKKKLVELTNEIDKKQRIVEEDNEIIDSLEQKIYESNNEVEVLNNEIKSLEENMKKNEEEIGEKKKEVERFKHVIDGRIRNLYKNIDTYSSPILRVFYTSENVLDYIDKIVSMNKFIELDRYTIEKVLNHISEIEVKNKSIESSKKLIDEKISKVNKTIGETNENIKILEEKKKEKENEINEIKKLNEELSNTYSAISKDKSEIHDEIVKLYEDNERLQEEQKKYMEKLNKENKKAKPKVKYGKYIKPVQGKITSRFGKRVHPVTGKESNHTGLDIAAPMGEGVKASLGGEVVSAGWYSNVYGNVVIINHGNNIQTFYAHLSKVLVKKGEHVNQGDIIAKVGTTGLSTGPHLHFEIYVNGERVDPEKRIK